MEALPGGYEAQFRKEMGTVAKAEKTFTAGRNETGLACRKSREMAGQVQVCAIGDREIFNRLCIL